jgi:putative DNA primase/helicase
MMNPASEQVYTERASLTTAAFPAELKSFRQWGCWRVEERAGKSAKVLYDPLTARRASVTDSRTWRSFDEACAALEIGDYAGLGFVFSSGDPFVGIDLDGCRDPETGELQEWAERVIEGLGGYAEVSPSGTGVHIIVRGRLPEGARNRRAGEQGNIEAYAQARFFTVTGRGL